MYSTLHNILNSCSNGDYISLILWSWDSSWSSREASILMKLFNANYFNDRKDSARHSDGELTKKVGNFIVYSALGTDKLHEMPGSPRGDYLQDRYSSCKGVWQQLGPACLFTFFMPSDLKKTI